DQYFRARDKIEEVIDKIKNRNFFSTLPEKNFQSIDIKSNTSREDFELAVKKAIDHIISGDCIQIVLSQRFSVDLKTDPISIYRTLRQINPSPYLFYLKMGENHLLGSSPEILVRLDQGRIQLRPIAGTRPRGKTEEEDKQLEQELLDDEKERAEHIMLVDLGRNDVGRVAELGTVKVDELMVVERYSHVMHIVSNVVGQLAKDTEAVDVLKAVFPAGTVSGAPKVRAMEIINELEKEARGPYAGAVGYFDFSGNMDFCINIRSFSITNNEVFFQVGAGIVADSDPQKEYQETINKAKALIKALEWAYSFDGKEKK
ncbi:MAG: anthranilate synthase component I, partial [Deltaproteobacteria bacterium]